MSLTPTIEAGKISTFGTIMGAEDGLDKFIGTGSGLAATINNILQASGVGSSDFLKMVGASFDGADDILSLSEIAAGLKFIADNGLRGSLKHRDGLTNIFLATSHVVKTVAWLGNIPVLGVAIRAVMTVGFAFRVRAQIQRIKELNQRINAIDHFIQDRLSKPYTELKNKLRTYQSQMQMEKNCVIKQRNNAILMLFICITFVIGFAGVKELKADSAQMVAVGLLGNAYGLYRNFYVASRKDATYDPEEWQKLEHLMANPEQYQPDPQSTDGTKAGNLSTFGTIMAAEEGFTKFVLAGNGVSVLTGCALTQTSFHGADDILSISAIAGGVKFISDNGFKGTFRHKYGLANIAMTLFHVIKTIAWLGKITILDGFVRGGLVLALVCRIRAQQKRIKELNIQMQIANDFLNTQSNKDAFYDRVQLYHDQMKIEKNSVLQRRNAVILILAISILFLIGSLGVKEIKGSTYVIAAGAVLNTFGLYVTFKVAKRKDDTYDPKAWKEIEAVIKPGLHHSQAALLV